MGARSLGVSPAYLSQMQKAVARHGLSVWDDSWWDGPLPVFEGACVLFHGSLGNAARLASTPWNPGAFCAVDRFRCASWYSDAAPWLLHREALATTAEVLVADPSQVAHLGAEVFVRPDSPLKPFSDRVVPLEGLTLTALDHGFYYNDSGLPVVVAPVRSIGREWRFVIVEWS